MAAKPAESNELPAEIGARILQAGVRLSAPRRAVLSALVAHDGHLSREELALRLRERGPRVSLSTVYRFMRVLVDLGIAREIRVGDTSRFELGLGREQHDHLVCASCGGITEFHDDRVVELARLVAADHAFSAQSPRVEIHAHCAVCSAAAARA